jgi:tetratricopeptide (TPR) repeat protein
LQSKLGDHQSARKHFDSSLSTLESIGDGKQYDSPRLVELAKTRSELSSFLAKMENKKSAIAMLRQSVEELEHSLGRDSKTLRIERIGQITIALNNQASIVLDQDPGQAASLLRRAAKMRLDLDSENEFRLNDRMLGAILHGNLGVAERKLGHAIFAEGQFQQAIDALDAILETHPDYVKAHVELAACYNNWAQLHLDNRDPDRAKSCFEQAKSLLTAAQLRFPMQPEIPRFLQVIQKNIKCLNGEEMSARIDDGKSKTMFVFEGEDSRYRQ